MPTDTAPDPIAHQEEDDLEAFFDRLPSETRDQLLELALMEHADEEGLISQETLAQITGLSVYKIRIIEKRALVKLRRNAESHGITATFQP